MKLVKLTNERFHIAFTKLIGQPVPLRTAFKLKGINAKIQEELRKFEECRQSAITKYGKKDAHGKLIIRDDNTVTFEHEQLQAFTAELNDLNETDIELASIKFDELGEKALLSADDLDALDGIVIE
jgi:hypothetical protein